MTSCASSDFVNKRQLWLEVLSGNDHNSIRNQLANLTLDAATFRLIYEARSLAPTATKGRVKLNGLVHELINRGFFTLCASGIRRLWDTGVLEGEKGVYALRPLLIDMKEHAHLFTREAVFEAEGLVYDYTSIQQAHDEYRRNQLLAGLSTYNVPMDLAWQLHERRHQDFDQLSGTTPANRQPGDTIKGTVFWDKKKEASSYCKKLSDYTTKNIAHAATPESRLVVEADNMSFSFDEMWSWLKGLHQITDFLNVKILGERAVPFLMDFQEDMLQYIDRPLVKTSDKELLAEVWHHLAKDCESWSR